MFRAKRLVELRCDACGTAWLLTSAQARFSVHRLHFPGGPGVGPIGQIPADEESLLALSASGSQMTSDTNEMLAIRTSLLTCPKCQSEKFTDRKVTRANPASADASRTELA
jgi:hypothetical protein